MSSNIAHLTPAVFESWPPANYENPERRTWMPIYSSIWFAAATIMVSMRYWLRARGHAGRLGLDDAILFPAWLAGLMFTALTMLFTQRAEGDRHIWDVEPDKRQYQVLYMWLGQFSFLVCGGCTKVSILFFYRRLVEGTYSKRWTWLVWAAIAFTIAYTVAFCIMLLVNCSPTEAYWKAFDPTYPPDGFTCLNTSAINTITGVCAAVSDVYSVALPCIITWHYAVPKRQKIALNVIFSLGLIVVIASCIRTYWLINTGRSRDMTWSAYNLFVWAQFELQVGIMCASAPSLRVFFRRYLGGSQNSRNLPSGTQRSAITVIRDTTVTTTNKAPPRGVPTDNKNEPNVFRRSVSEDSLPTSTQSEERLTRYSHEEDAYAMNDMSWKDPAGQQKRVGAWAAKAGH